MTRSADQGHSELDFDRDLPTTPEDVEALRSLRPKARYGDLKDLDRMRPPEGLEEREGLRKPFGDWPPFEL
jgi:hypothetical protein